MASTSRGISPQIPQALAEFDLLPNSAHVDIHVVKGVLGCSDSYVWAKVKSGELSKPHKFGRASRWNVGDLRAYVARNAQ